MWQSGVTHCGCCVPHTPRVKLGKPQPRQEEGPAGHITDARLTLPTVWFLCSFISTYSLVC